jgi:acetyl-CoA synthetase
MTTVGEPIEPEVWKWYHKEVGKGEAIIVDTWWQTETGGFLCSTLPGIKPMKPGSAGPGMPGIHPIIFDDDGKVIPRDRQGRQHLHPESLARACSRPSGATATVSWTPTSPATARIPKHGLAGLALLTGDAAVEAEDGYYRILGRIDDVINVSGHRLGTKEIESAALVVEEVAEAAVVPVNHDIKGKEPDLYIALKPGFEAVTSWPRKSRCGLHRNRQNCQAAQGLDRPDMPKTRSGKIMRRVLGALSNKGDVGDVMTLANPEIVEEIKKWSRNNPAQR